MHLRANLPFMEQQSEMGDSTHNQLLDTQAGAGALGNVTLSDAASESATGKKASGCN